MTAYVFCRINSGNFVMLTVMKASEILTKLSIKKRL